MAGIYIHIPYCKQACIYCDFHFSTTLKNKSILLQAIGLELELRKEELATDQIETIYFGGGTPSICSKDEIAEVLNTIQKNYTVSANCEITLEANPDDLTSEVIRDIMALKINRLSIGVQSFFEEDLVWMHRAHNATQAEQCIIAAQNQGLTNLSVDLIFATPLLTPEKLETNLARLTALRIPHLSCYNLTVEEKTNLHHQVKNKKVNIVPDEIAAKQFYFIHDYLAEQGYEHYEISNYAKLGAYSKHNTAYWQGKKYLGVGPSAHSFNGMTRSWNIKNNELYIKNLLQRQLPSEMEVLTPENKFNEFILTGLRTNWGISIETMKKEFAPQYLLVKSIITRLLEEEKLSLRNGNLTLKRLALINADSIASELFII